MCTQYDFRFHFVLYSYKYDSCFIIIYIVGGFCPELKNDTFAHWHKAYEGIVYTKCFEGYRSRGPNGLSFRECRNDTWQPIVLKCESIEKRAMDDSADCIKYMLSSYNEIGPPRLLIDLDDMSFVNFNNTIKYYGDVHVSDPDGCLFGELFERQYNNNIFIQYGLSDKTYPISERDIHIINVTYCFPDHRTTFHVDDVVSPEPTYPYFFVRLCPQSDCQVNASYIVKRIRIQIILKYYIEIACLPIENEANATHAAMVGGETSIGECAQFYYYPIDGKKPERKCGLDLEWGEPDTNCKELSITI